MTKVIKSPPPKGGGWEGAVSAVINTYNAEETLRQTLESVKDFDEVLVCDMESTDGTLAIAREYGCRIVTFPKGEHRIVEPARNFAIRSAAHEWVLVLDADEVVPAALKDYLTSLREPTALYIPRKNFFMKRFMHAAYPDYILRFLPRDKTDWPEEIHSVPQVSGEVRHLPKSRTDLALVHLAPNTLKDRLNKTNTYTEYELLKKKDKHYGVVALLWRPLFRFFKAYILKKGFLDGLPGLIWAIYEAIYQTALVSKKIEQEVQE